MPGGVFILFSSWKALRAVHAKLRKTIKGRPLWMQGEAGNDALLAAFAEAGNAVLLGVDTFWQGVDVPGEAHLPKEYVEADDARLEAYRRLAGVSTLEELNDLRIEWIDRYGALPLATVGLLELAQLRLVCLDLGVASVKVLPARVGLRSKPVLKLGPLTLSISQQLRLRRTHGSSAYNDTTKELRLELSAGAVTSHSILSLLEEVNAPSSDP